MQRSQTDAPKYALAEIERRFVVDLAALPALEAAPWFEIEDLYLSSGRLRLRTVTAADGQTQFKLCKKYGNSMARASGSPTST